jgi:hypothetical protein
MLDFIFIGGAMNHLYKYLGVVLCHAVWMGGVAQAQLNPPACRIVFSKIDNPLVTYTLDVDARQFSVPRAGSASRYAPRYHTNPSWVQLTLRQIRDNDQVDDWTLTVMNRNAQYNIAHVYFPYDVSDYYLGGASDAANDVLLEPDWLGVAWLASNAGVRRYSYGDDDPSAAPAFAPVHIKMDGSRARLMAAANWPPVPVVMYVDNHKQGLLYRNQNIAPGRSRNYACKYHLFTPKSPEINPPWMAAVDGYQSWLHAKMGDVDYPEWMRNIHGMISVNLQNCSDEMLSSGYVPNMWYAFRDKLPWIQFWGQMSGYHEECCELDQAIHPRYTRPGGWSLPAFVDGCVDRVGGERVGLYTRPLEQIPLEEPENLDDWFLPWQDMCNTAGGANAYYHDVVGRRGGDDMNFVARLYDRNEPGGFSEDTIIEGALDIYPTAYFVSASIDRDGVEGGPGHAIANLSKTLNRVPFPQFGTYLLNDRIMFDGQCNGQGLLWGDYWVERQCFLLGHKFEGNPWETYSAPDGFTWNPAMKRVIDLRDPYDAQSNPDGVGWWSRELRYQDRRGIRNVPGGIDVRRFEDNSDPEYPTELFVIDNWSRLRGKTFTFAGSSTPISIPDTQLSIVEFEY